jgi:3-hydroxyisobutyrate dehydrogenase-like beta-hydroxyacid dehydrogenase
MTIGFMGFGEAAHGVAKGLRASGAGSIAAYDVNAADPALGDRIRRRASDAAVDLVDRLEDLVRRAEVVVCAVPGAAAEQAAAQAAPLLEARHYYVDLSSTSPAVKQSAARLVEASGARFVEAAVMGAVAVHGHRAPMLLAGAYAADVVRLLAPYGMRLEAFSEVVGSAAAVKMLRSIVIKGLEALLLECLLGASRYGVEERVLASVGESFPGLDWNRTAHYLVGRTVRHGERRAHEMGEAAETLRALGIEPIMAEAAARRLRWAAALSVGDRLDEASRDDYRTVMRAIHEADRV